MGDQGSRIGFNVSEDMGGGLKAFGNIEWNLDVADGTEDTSGTGAVTTRQTLFGVSGSFGKVLMGKAYAPYKLIGSADVFADTPADAQGDIVGVGHDSAYSQAIAYVSPDVNGFHLAVAVTNNGTSGVNVSDSVSTVLVYNNGPLAVSYGHEKQGKLTIAANANDTAQKLNVSYKLGDLKVAATHETQDNSNGVDSKADLISATYGMGPITLAAQYGKLDIDNTATGDVTRSTVGAIYSLSKRTSVAALYSMNKADGTTKVNTTGVQLNHSF